ncbi:hypothetical protein AXF42_Ash014243 [Apostasia shenzhenica]|uniref:Uncharacterized protein n=1 Tax=Apostasia shenzhenica TaxID=1088818 RepID=A0A2I0A1C3_9ASPA|nr:hypothetical protein AXF42_Ash014243 [Apostasia shenzhenica]
MKSLMKEKKNKERKKEKLQTNEAQRKRCIQSKERKTTRSTHRRRKRKRDVKRSYLLGQRTLDPARALRSKRIREAGDLRSRAERWGR